MLMKNKEIIKIIKKAENLIFPRRCPVCDDVVPVGEGLVCYDCIPKIKYINGNRCRKCSKQLLDKDAVYCEDCKRRDHVYDFGYALYDYQSMKNSLFRFKYKNRCEYAEFYAKDLCERMADVIKYMEADAIIPIPLHKDRLNSRGYNQAEILAKEVSRICNIPVYDKYVTRIKKTVPQKELDVVGRQNNLKKAFNISPDVVKLNKTILIDDIYTTGSTIDSVASELKKQGIRTVYFITLCIGEGI